MSHLTTFTNTQRLNVAFITSPGNGGDASVAFVTGVSGYLSNLITVSAAGVSSLNLLSGALNLVGTGNISVTQNGQTIYISGSSEAVANLSGYITTGEADSRYYGIDNPSGFITGFNSGIYLLKSETGSFQVTGNYVNSGDLNSYYPINNPSGFITGINTGSFASVQNLFLTGKLNYDISTGISGYLASLILNSSAGVGSINSKTGILNLTGAGNTLVTVNGQLIVISGDVNGLISTGDADNRYYSNSNPSGYLTNLSGLSVAFVTGVSGSLKSDLDLKLDSSLTGQFADKVALGLTGQSLGARIDSINNATGLFYLVSNPSGYITGVSTGEFVTRSETGRFQPSGDYASNGNLFQTGSFLDQKINSLSGNNYYPSFNPSGFITGINTGDFALIQNLFLTGKFNYEFTTGASGYLQSLIVGSTAGVSSVNSQTGALNFTGAGNNRVFVNGQLLTISGDVNGLISTGQADLRYYSNNNPSGFLNTLSGLSVGYVSGVSGALQSQIGGGPVSLSKTLAYFTALDNQPPITGFANFDTFSGIAVINYIDSSVTSAVFNGLIPEGVTINSGVCAKYLWITTGISGNCRWRAEIQRMDGVNFNTGRYLFSGESNGVTVSGSSAITDINITGISSIFSGGIPFRIRVSRVGDDAINDTLVQPAQLMSVEVRSL